LRKPIQIQILMCAALVACGAEPNSASETASKEREAQRVNTETETEGAETVSAAKAPEISFTVPADTKAKYQLIAVSKNMDGVLVATTRRTGPSGSSYSVREIDCARQLFKYVGDGDTLEEAKTPLRNPGKMATLVEGSSSHAAVQIACSNSPD